jgi:hypothetical protein
MSRSPQSATATTSPLRRSPPQNAAWNNGGKKSYSVLPAATQKAVYGPSEHLAACNQHHLEIAEKFDSAMKRRLIGDAERCAT